LKNRPPRERQQWFASRSPIGSPAISQDFVKSFEVEILFDVISTSTDR